MTYSCIKRNTHTLIHLDSFIYVYALTIHHRLSSNDVNDEQREKARSEKRENEEKEKEVCVMVVISSRNYHIPTKQQKFIHVYIYI